MREVGRVEDLPGSLAAAAHEAAAAFGDGSVYLERVLRPARHVEVQLLGDSTRVVALGERDCSIQRRHQKLVEEAPAPELTREQRRTLHRHAVDMGRAAGLRGASTAEFLLDEKGRPWFLEVNTRLQVEHGITELVSGVDLVHEQLRIAAGGLISDAALDAAKHAADPRGHAIEVRLTAEDPADGFRPYPGRISRWTAPAGPGVRVDSGVEAGSTIPGAYDSLVAKVMTWATDRAGAIDRLRRALDELEVAGIQTDLPFLRFVVDDPEFAAARLDTGYVDRVWRPGSGREAAAEAAVAAATLLVTQGADGPAIGSAPAGGGFGAAVPGQAQTADARRELSAEPSAWRDEGRKEGVDRWP
jgi:acetyl/propionyl-CoA carboxylase alpha subunit